MDAGRTAVTRRNAEIVYVERRLCRSFGEGSRVARSRQTRRHGPSRSRCDERRAETDPVNAAAADHHRRRGCVRTQAMSPRPIAALSVLLLLAAGPAANSQPATPAPKLVVIVVVDQLRFEYLERYSAFWTAGLKRLMTEGAVFDRAF